MKSPRVSVVIPAHNEAVHIGQQLSALSAQVTDGEAEIIVVDNASTDGTASVVAHLGLPSVTVIQCDDGRGAAHARNHGASHATGDVLLFCDADDVVGDDWLAGMAAAAREYEFFGGRVDTAALDQLEPDEVPGRFALPRDLDWVPWGISCNLGIRRATFERLGGWNEAYECGEDIELSWRAAVAGVKFTPVEALVLYRPRPTPRLAFVQGFKWGRAAPKLRTDFAEAGFTGRTWRDASRDWVRLLRNALFIIGNEWNRREAARLAGLLIGRLVGCVGERTFLP